MNMENSIKLPEFKLGKGYDSLELSLGISDYRAHVVRAAVLFECISNEIVCTEFYENPEEVPEEMLQMPAVLTKAFEHITDFKEQIYMLLIFGKGYININSLLENERNKPEMDDNVKEFSQALEGAIKETLGDVDAFSLNTVKRFIKKHGFNFEKFVDSLIDKDNYDHTGKYLKTPAPLSEQITEEKLNELNDKINEILKKTLAKNNKKEGENGSENTSPGGE